MRPRTIKLALPAADADGICASQTPSGAGNLTINGALASGGVATLSSANCQQRRIRITCAGADAGRTFTLTGTFKDMHGNSRAATFTMAGSNAGTTDSLVDMATVTQIAVDAATAGAITVGTNGVGSTPWQIPAHDIPAPFAISLFGVIATGGTVNWDFEHTPKIPPVTIAADADIPAVFDNADLAGETANQSGNYVLPVGALRGTINSGTDFVEFTWQQAGVIGGPAG